MADLSGLFVFFGAVGFIFLKFMLGMLLKEQGLFRLLITIGIGLGMLIGATFVAPTCAPLAIILVTGAIIFGGLPIVVMFMFVGAIPFIGASLATVIAPISGMLWVLLIITIVEFIVSILHILALVPIINIIIIALAIILPIIELVILWAVFSGAFADVTTCFSLAGTKIPGTGGISIGA
jgi:hypothetical protein